MPPGHRVMPKQEQQETLNKLKNCEICFWKLSFYSKPKNLADQNSREKLTYIEMLDAQSRLFFPFSAQAELMRQISCLPIRTDTLTMRKKKEDLDRKLAEVEEAIKIFSRPKVFIKMDS